MKHMTLLESTGLVDFDALPTAAPLAAAPVNGNGPADRDQRGRRQPGAWSGSSSASPLVVGLVTAVRVVRPR